MNINLKQINPLPTPTWNKLSVNSSALLYESGEPGPACQPVISGLTEGVSLISCQDNDITYIFENIPTGMGSEADRFVRDHCRRRDVLTVGEGRALLQPIVLNYSLPDGALELNDLIIHAGKDSSFTVILNHTSPTGSKGFHGERVKLSAEQGAKVHLIQVQLLGDEWTHFHDLGGLCMENSSVRLTQLQLGGKEAVCGCHMELKGDESAFESQVSYLLHGSQRLDMNYTTVHRGRKTISSLDTVGTLMGSGSKLFRGTIDFVRGCKGASGTESEDVLLMGPNVHNQTVPLILCGEDEVEGDHSAAVGEIDPEQLYYMMSRQIDEQGAKKLLVQGRLERVCGQIPDEAIRRAVKEYCQEVFEHDQSISM